MAKQGITLKIRNLDALRKITGRFPAIAAQITSKGINRMIFAIEEKAVPLTPVQTGRLRGSFVGARILSTPFTLQGRVGTKLNYAPFVHFGTGIFGPRGKRIVPRQAKAMRWQQGGRTIFAKSTKGQKPNPFFQKGIDAATPQLDRIAVQTIQQITRAIANLGRA